MEYKNKEVSLKQKCWKDRKKKQLNNIDLFRISAMTSS